MTGSADQSGARRTPPPGGDPDVWARRLRRILDEQISLYEQLEALSKLQSRAIAEEDADQLLTILGQREAIIGELMRLNEDLSPFVENWADLSVRLPVQQRDALSGAFDRVGATIGAATVGLAAISLLIGAIGIANVMLISVTERTREIGVRLAVGARRDNVLAQFLMEAAFLSGLGGVLGVAAAVAVGLALNLLISGFSAVPPLWSVAAGVTSSVVVGVGAGYLPARRAAALDPAEALRHE